MYFYYAAPEENRYKVLFGGIETPSSTYGAHGVYAGIAKTFLFADEEVIEHALCGWLAKKYSGVGVFALFVVDVPQSAVCKDPKIPGAYYTIAAISPTNIEFVKTIDVEG